MGALPSSALHDEATIRPMRPTKTYAVRVPGEIDPLKINNSGSFTNDPAGTLNRDLREGGTLRQSNLSLAATLLLQCGQKRVEKRNLVAVEQGRHPEFIQEFASGTRILCFHQNASHVSFSLDANVAMVVAETVTVPGNFPAAFGAPRGRDTRNSGMRGLLSGTINCDWEEAGSLNLNTNTAP